MTGKRQFTHDRTALLLVSINVFLALVTVVLTSLKLNATRGTANYIISYRESLGLDSYTQGTAWDISSFIVAAVGICILSVILAYRSFSIRRELSLIVLALTVPLLALIVIVSNALLILR